MLGCEEKNEQIGLTDKIAKSIILKYAFKGSPTKLLEMSLDYTSIYIFFNPFSLLNF